MITDLLILLFVLRSFIEEKLVCRRDLCCRGGGANKPPKTLEKDSQKVAEFLASRTVLSLLKLHQKNLDKGHGKQLSSMSKKELQHSGTRIIEVKSKSSQKLLIIPLTPED